MSAYLLVICGPMFAGKTSELIRRVAAWKEDGRNADVVVIRPSWDDRYQSGTHQVVTHDGMRHDALPARNAAEVQQIVKAGHGVIHNDASPRRLVAIDEAHFFGTELFDTVRNMLRRNINVLVAGVDLDHRGDAFEPFPKLLAEADEVLKLAGTCSRCGGLARHSQRIRGGEGRIEVGGASEYEPKCRNCFEM